MLIETRWRELNMEEAYRSVDSKLMPHINEMILGEEAGLMDKMFRFVDELLVRLNERIEEQLRQGEDSWLFEDVEYLHGIAFVAGQRYISATCGAWKVTKRDALMLGQKTVKGTSYATVVNATANFWKHSDEWDFGNLNPQQKGTIGTIESLGVTVAELEPYVITNVTHKLGIKKFVDLAPIMERWSIAVAGSIPSTPST